MGNSVDYVRLSSEIFIRKFEAENGCKVQGVLFNKYMTLLHRNLKQKGYDIRLPHCWYRWGDEVVRYNMPYLSWNHEFSAYTQVSLRDIESTPLIDEHDDVLAYASEYADEFIEKYSGEEGAELAIDEVYDRAPFIFQNDYRKLRESLKNINKNKTSMCLDYEGLLGSLFKSAMENFPREFDRIRKEKEQFESVFQAMLEKNAPIYDIYNAAEDFWFYFCYYLRLNRKCYENLSRTTLTVWENAIPEEKELFDLKLQSYAHQYGTNSKNANVRSLDDQWKINDLGFNDLLSAFPNDDGEGLDSFIRGVRKGDE